MPRRPRWVTALAAALAVIALLPLFAAAHDASPAAGDPIDHPTGAGEVVLRIDETPGFVPVEYALTMMPRFTLYGDGLVVVQGPVPAIFPGPALPNLRTLRLTEDGVQTVLAAARDAGILDGDRALDNQMVTDLSTTLFIATASGRTTVVSVYGLGTAEEQLPADERADRATLAEFQSRLLDLADESDQRPGDAGSGVDQAAGVAMTGSAPQPASSTSSGRG